MSELGWLFDLIKNASTGSQYDAAQERMAAGKYEPISSSMFVDPAVTAKLNEAMKGTFEKKDAGPLQSRMDDISLDPQFQTPEGRKELRDDPKFWLGADGQGQQGIKVNPSNTYANEALNQFRKKQQTILDLQGGNLAQLAVESPTVLKDFTEAGGRIATADKTRAEAGKIDSDLKYFTNKQATSQRFAQSLLNDPEFQKMTPDAQVRTLMQNNMTAEDAIKAAEAANVYRKTRNVEGGYGKGQDIQYTVDERTGNVIGTVGTPQDQQRKSTRVSVNPVIQQESSYSKGTGTHLASRESGIISDGDSADSTMYLVGTLEKALKESPSGKYAKYGVKANEYSGGLLGSSNQEAGAYKQAQTINKMMTLENIKKLGPGINSAEREFMMESQASPDLTPTQQRKVLEIFKKDAAYKQKRRDQLVNGTYSDNARQDPARSELNVRSTQPAPASSRYKVLEVK